MNKEQWRQKQKSLDVPIRLHIANHELPIESISYIGEICITKNLIVGFTVYMLDGSKIEFYYGEYKLEPIVKNEKVFWLFNRKLICTDIQQYFDRNCKTLQKVNKLHQKVVNTIMQYHRFKIKSYRLKQGNK